MLSLEWFLHGLASMSPIGVFLPWREVIILASHSGWSAELCRLAAETLLDLGAVEVQFWQEGSVHDPQKYKSIRVLPIPEICPPMGRWMYPVTKKKQPNLQVSLRSLKQSLQFQKLLARWTQARQVPIQPHQNL